jgi:hypothetical protein
VFIMPSSSVVRTCARCGLAKPFDEFPIKDKTSGTLRSYCRPCYREYGKEHYRSNLDYYKAKANIARTRDRSGNRAIVDAFLAAHPCIDCGESDPVVPDFDHVDPTLKLEAVGRIQHSGGRGRLLIDIGKCVVRCGNCHRRRTARQFGWYRVWLASS